MPQDAAALTSIDQIAAANNLRAAFIRRSLEQGTCFVCELNDALLGYSVLDYSFFSHGMIVMLYTKPQSRRCGIASSLIQHCEMACQTPKLFTSTNQSNKPMQALLAKRGFVPSGVIENLDEGDPELLYFKSLKLPAKQKS